MPKHARGVCAAAAAGLALSALGPGMAADAATSGAIPGSVVGGRLYNVAANSANDVWAVGLNDNGSLVMHWNGSAWTSTSTGLGFLYDVATTGASNAWAVGWTDYNNTLILHWNGTSWS